jgi:hypothetical protein
MDGMKTEKEKKKFELKFGPDGKPIWPKRPEMTPERLEAIKQLDELRSGKDEDMPEVPLAAIVYVKDYTEIPLANEAYALVTVTGEGKKTWKLAIRRGAAKPRTKMLFVSSDAALPIEPRYRNEDVTRCKEKKYRFGVAVVPRLLPHVQRHIYRLNSGVLYPLKDFPELKSLKKGTEVSAQLNIRSQKTLKALMIAIPYRKS